MKKGTYLLIQESQCNSLASFRIVEEAPNVHLQQENTVLSDMSLYKQPLKVGNIHDNQTSCMSCLGCGIKSLQLIMYDQSLSIAQTVSKGCLGLQCCCMHEIVVATSNKVQIGSITKTCGSLFFCQSTKLEVLNENKQLLYSIQSKCCQFSILIPCCGFLGISPTIRYEIRDFAGKDVGYILDLSPQQCGFKKQLQITFPAASSLREKTLLMNAAALLV